MKDFNIENLERKNCYKTPDNFFEQMQNNVLERVGEKPAEVKAKTFRLNWWYAAAACIVMIFGMVLFNNNNTMKGTGGEEVNLADAKPKIDQNNSVTEPTKEQENFFAFANEVEKVIETKKAEVVTPTVAKAEKQVSKVPSKNVTFSEVEIENFIESMSQEELSMITQNNIQDIYLDLYY